MAETTGISWTDHTANFWWGCQRVSPGCEHCYAEQSATVRHKLKVWGPPSTTERQRRKGVWSDVPKWNAAALRPDAAPVAHDLDAIEAAARADAPRCACCGDVATRICRGCCNTWCNLHDGDEPNAPQCPDGMEPIDNAAGDARVTLVAEVRRLRMELYGARHALAEASRGRAAASLRAADAEHVATVAMRDGLAECERLRWDVEFLDSVISGIGKSLRAGEMSRVGLCSHARDVAAERDAALAAVDAVRADYAPRATPPTADEVRALNRLRYGAYAPERQVPVLVWRSDWPDEVRVQWTHVREDAPGGPQVQRLEWSSAWQAMGPDGPVAWSALARLVAQGGAR